MRPEPVVLLTRPAGENAALATRLAARGIASRELPCIRIEPLTDAAPLRDAVLALGPSDLLVVTSAAGARAIVAALDGRTAAASVAAVGPATAAACAAAGLRVTFQPTVATGAALAAELPLPPGAILLAQSDLAGPETAAALRARGAVVGVVVAYRTVALSHEQAPDADAVVFASPSAVDGFAAAGARPRIAIAIGPRTADRCRARFGSEPIVATPDPERLARSIETALEGHRAAVGR